jgi:hypothetical protein
MNRQTTRILIGALWLASLAGTYFLGLSANSPGKPRLRVSIATEASDWN